MMGAIERRYGAHLDARRAAGLDRRLTPLGRSDARSVVRDGRRLINFAANDALGLSFHAALIERAREWAAAYGAGAGASRLVSGNVELFELIEAKLAALKEKEAALVLASGFQANATIIAALLDAKALGAEPLVFSDKLNHASIHFGCKAAGARQIRYAHGEVVHLASLLESNQSADQPKFILTESVFSMDGDRVSLDEIAVLARAHDAMLIVDDAHATGLYGPGGAGLGQAADVVIGTFSKALGSFGAYVACSARIRDYLVNACSGLIYSTALPPPVLGAIDAALDLLPSLDSERARVAAMADTVREAAYRAGLATGASTTHIVPLMVGEGQAALDLSAHLAGHGLFAPAIRPPAVPRGSARVRLSMSAAHEDADVEALCAALARAQARAA